MDALLGKLTNLGYELFGVIIPGMVVSVFLLLWWIALGQLAPRWTYSAVGHLRPAEFWSVIDSVHGGRTAASVVIAMMLWYFLGHAVNWASKARPRKKGGWKERRDRVWRFLILHIERPSEPFDKNLKLLFESIRSKLSSDGRRLEWREFYPLAKTMLSNSGRHSLISTYQNKYTLHRSIAAAAACLFWLVFVSTIAALFAVWRGAEAPHWFLLASLLIAAVIVVTGFSATYHYFWTLWGDTVITESYAVLVGHQQEAADGSR